MNLRSAAVDTANSNTVTDVGFDFEFPKGTDYTIVNNVADAICDDIIARQRRGEIVMMDPTTLAVTSTVPVVVDPLADKRSALESAVTADVQAGKMSQATADALGALLSAMAPR